MATWEVSLFTILRMALLRIHKMIIFAVEDFPVSEVVKDVMPITSQLSRLPSLV
jgi:hypothetical protein